MKQMSILAGIALIAVLIFASCDLTTIDNVGFARDLLQKTADSSGAYTPPGKTVIYDQDGLTIDLETVSVAYPESVFTAESTFFYFRPSFAPDSVVTTGTLDSDIIVNMETLIVTITFVGILNVKGENEGTYDFDCALEIDLDTGTYTWSGSVKISDDINNIGKG